MHRRGFLGAGVTGGMFAGSAAAASQAPRQWGAEQGQPFLERNQSGKPHQGKMLAVIQPHNDDVPLFAAGTVLKLIDEGYEGILIRATNDDHAGSGATPAEVIANNEDDNFDIARRMGLKQVFDLGYQNHRLDDAHPIELRARLIFIFRVMKVNTVVCYDPWGHYEENPDHYFIASAVEAACWMSGGRWDFPEHRAAGIAPHGVSEKYYFARGPQLVNRVVDISAYVDKKVDVNIANDTQGPAGVNGSRLRRRLAEQGKKLPVLGDDDDTANRQYIKEFVLENDRELGREFGVEYAEKFHYIGPETSKLDDYITRNAVSV
ncbi:MAG: PIG-L family deacetylase [Acidobacteria bacterium]|nr:PIG-L family deacetylase [Acidobacteriota bacterium]